MTISFTLEFLYLYVPTASFYMLMQMSGSVIETGRGSFCFLRVPMSQNDCFMKVKLSVFGVHWVSVITLSHHACVQSVQDFATRFYFYYIEKVIDQCETKMTDTDPSIVGQHVQPLKHNYFKAWAGSSYYLLYMQIGYYLSYMQQDFWICHWQEKHKVQFQGLQELETLLYIFLCT